MKKENKTNRKNKTNQSLNFPTESFWTIQDMLNLNKDVVPITLRVKLNKELQNKTIAEIGTKHVGKGRPRLVFSSLPVSKETLKKAADAGVLLKEPAAIDVASASKINVKSVAPSDEKQTQENETSVSA